MSEFTKAQIESFLNQAQSMLRNYEEKYDHLMDMHSGVRPSWVSADIAFLLEDIKDQNAVVQRWKEELETAK